MTRSHKWTPQATRRIGKYVVTAQSFRPTARTVTGPQEWCDAAELIRRFPQRVAAELIGTPHELPEFRFRYVGTDSAYAGGVMPPLRRGADFLLRVRGGRVLGRYGEVHGPEQTGLLDTSWQQELLSVLRNGRFGRWHPRYWKHAARAAVNQRLPEPQRCPGRVAVLNAPGSGNYFHWIAEILPRLLTLQRSGCEVDWYLVDRCTSFQRETLNVFEIPAEQIIQPWSGLYLEADELLVPSRGFPGACRETGAELVRRCGLGHDPSPTRRIFVNRRRSRRVRNAADLQQLLQHFAFEEHYMEDVSVVDQLRLFRNADIVLGLHGAGLANLITCRPGTHVIELMPRGKREFCYPTLSRLGQFRHTLITAPRVGFHQDMLVPIAELRSVLQDILRPKSADARP